MKLQRMLLFNKLAHQLCFYVCLYNDLDTLYICGVFYTSSVKKGAGLLYACIF
jgi:hypothetical protein